MIKAQEKEFYSKMRNKQYVKQCQQILAREQSSRYLLQYTKSLPPTAESLRVALDIILNFGVRTLALFHPLYQTIHKGKISGQISILLSEIAEAVHRTIGERNIPLFTGAMKAKRTNQECRIKAFTSQDRLFLNFHETVAKITTGLNFNQAKSETFQKIWENIQIEKKKFQQATCLYKGDLLPVDRQSWQAIIVQFQQLRQKQQLCIENPMKMEQNSELICCRRYFLREELLPLNTDKLIFLPFRFKKKEMQEVVCSLLNSLAGGIILFGAQTRKVSGVMLSEQSRVIFKNDVRNACSDISPKLQDQLSFRFIPVHNPKTKTAIRGLFIVKLQVLWAQKRLYSLLSDSRYNVIDLMMKLKQREDFMMMNDEEPKLIKDSQRVLELFHSRFFLKRQASPFHPEICKEPDPGEFLENQEIQDEIASRTQHISQEKVRNQRQEWVEQPVKMKGKDLQKGSQPQMKNVLLTKFKKKFLPSIRKLYHQLKLQINHLDDDTVWLRFSDNLKDEDFTPLLGLNENQSEDSFSLFLITSNQVKISREISSRSQEIDEDCLYMEKEQELQFKRISVNPSMFVMDSIEMTAKVFSFLMYRGYEPQFI